MGSRPRGWRCIAAFFAAVVALGMACVPLCAQTNAIYHLGFEPGDADASLFIPAESQGKSCTFAIVPDSPHSGAFCARMTAVDFARFAIVPKDKVSFPSAGRYRFSIWVRAGEGFQITDGVPGFVLRLNMSPSPPAMTLFYILPDGRVGQDHLPAGTAASLPTTWTQVGAVLDIPTNVTTLVPNLFMWGGKGEIFVDDLSVEKVPDNTPLTPVLPASDAHAPASSPTASSATSGAPLLSVRPDRSDGVYATGETAVWTVDLLSGDRSAFAAVPYEIRQDGADVVARGVVNLSAGPAQITATRHDPGVLVVAVLAKNGAKDLRQLGGAVFDPYKIAPAGPTPSDFDSFWKSKLQDLAAIPIHPVETTESLEGSPAGNGIDYSKITLDNIWNTHVQGQLARPSGPGKFPAMLILQYAGVYPLAKDPVVKAAQQGFMALNIQAHDIPIDAPASYYETLKATTLKNYTSIGIESRDTSYFVRMLMGAVRAAQYLMSRPDWDGKVLLVTGESQGGLQAFATAALCPGVTSVMTYVPAGCDVFAPEGHPPRGGSWPSVYFPKKSDDPDGSKARRVLAYFDTASFAARIHCPAFIAVGLIDETARPAGVFAAYNSIPRTDKEIMIFPLSDHHGAGNARQAAYLRADIWKKAMQRGAPLPPTS